ncbi:hypothetical protein [Flavobacterium restrictum]|uniref:Uncharacterized protein n=1 Tax=Flavobacterium restrictum TaxID=2594428 RepID=A0A553ED71_9FLAO|nr:hypothetical protein [Flavobacterium restrictum]TRX42987.1 hypothetical protein FNW21_01235 [Flavobacterium restrictum]
MKAILTQYKIDSMLEDIGSDITMIHIFFKTATRPEARMPVILPYDKLTQFIQTIDEQAFDYLTKIRSSIAGYGPKHTAVFKILESENFDLTPYLKRYVEALTPTYIAQQYEWCDSIVNNPSNTEKVQNSFKEIQKIANPDFINRNVKMDQFRDEIDQTLHELVLKFFPELFENGPECLSEYRDILVRTTLNFFENIDKLTFKNEK